VITPAPPVPQTAPVQEAGTKLSMPLPYQPDASAWTDCGTSRLYVTMTNAGTASAHFSIYANAYGTDGPWQYDVGSNDSANVFFGVATNLGGQYDFTCYGPNGFQRRFAGRINHDCNQIEATSSIDANAGSITLVLQNSTAATVTFVATDGYGLGGP
jgi:phospholipase C